MGRYVHSPGVAQLRKRDSGKPALGHNHLVGTEDGIDATGPRAPRVLLVDDHQVFADLLGQALDMHGMDVTGVCGTVADAIRQVTHDPPDVVVLDHGLPAATGVTAITELKQRAPTAKILMLTGDQDRSVLRDAMAAGCDGFLTKRQNVDAVIAAVRAVLDGQTPISPDVAGWLVGRGTGPAGDDLTPRETDILELIGEGMTNREIADRLGISVNTVRNHIQHLLTKLDAHSKLEAVTVASRGGLLRMR